MDDLEHLRRTLEHYRQQREQKLEEVRLIEMMIRQLEIDLGEPGSAVDLPSPEPQERAQRSGGISLRPDEFFGMSQGDAAKAYLRKVGRAVPFDELVAALRKGGATLGGKDPKKTLYVSLARNPKKEFVWPSADHISLGEFYGKDRG